LNTDDWLLIADIRRIGMLHADDVIAGVDVVDLA
jgi:hypothetical protein